MRVIILGSAAGGGVPQWNCGCANCRTARAGGDARTQSTLAVSTDDKRWVLLNASPDLRQQLLGCPRLWPTGLRQSPLRAVVLTDGELDHTVGLLALRETAEPLSVYAADGVLGLLAREWPILPLLERYDSAYAHSLPDGTDVRLTDSAGVALGLSCTAVGLARRAPRYAQHACVERCTVGVRITDERTGAVLAYVPAAEGVGDDVRRLAQGAALLCFDGTFWSDGELAATRSGAPTARAMGHLPVGGSAGSLGLLGKLGAARTVLVHMNNTNPILDPQSPERRAVEAAGVLVAADGMEFEL